MNPVLVVSPHLDDAVFSVGQFLAGRPGTVVVTMLAGAPNPPLEKTVWDESCGFSDSQQAIEARRAEDESALALLNATPVHLDFLDRQYEAKVVSAFRRGLRWATGHSSAAMGLANAVKEQVERRRPEFVIGPLGVGHPDHVRVRMAVLTADLPVPVWLYEDLPYSVNEPEVTAAALEEIQSLGYTLEPASIGSGSLTSKIEALGHYPSQMRHYNIDSLIVPERFWRVNPDLAQISFSGVFRSPPW
jgi:LmbE family N-acetylglucosaminyl deacetylase